MKSSGKRRLFVYYSRLSFLATSPRLYSSAADKTLSQMGSHICSYCNNRRIYSRTTAVVNSDLNKGKLAAYNYQRMQGCNVHSRFGYYHHIVHTAPVPFIIHQRHKQRATPRSYATKIQQQDDNTIECTHRIEFLTSRYSDTPSATPLPVRQINTLCKHGEDTSYYKIQES